jgi:nucleoside-diphosphate-sugar epimerase
MLSALIRDIKPHWIFHLAAHGAYSSQTGVQQMIQTNFIGTVNLVEASLKSGFEAFVNVGSSSEYGFKDHAPSEKDYLEPNSHYAVTKAAATLFCRYTAQAQGAPLVTLRLYSVYGPWEEPTRLMPTMIMRGLQGDLPPLVNPEITRDLVYVDDVMDACLLAVTQADQEQGAVYNIGMGTELSMGQIVAAIRRILNIQSEPQWGSMPNRRWDTSVWRADNKYTREALGWRPQYDFNRGFEKMLGWFRDNPDMLKFYQHHRALPA